MASKPLLQPTLTEERVFQILIQADVLLTQDGLVHDLPAKTSLGLDLRWEPDTFDLLKILELKELDVRALVNPVLCTHDHVVVLAYPNHALGVTSFFLNIIILWLGVDRPGIGTIDLVILLEQFVIVITEIVGSQI